MVLGELFYGANYSRRSAANVAKRRSTRAESHTIVDLDLETARQYGIIKSELRRKGTPIPNNDIWIAALTQQYERRGCHARSALRRGGASRSRSLVTQERAKADDTGGASDAQARSSRAFAVHKINRATAEPTEKAEIRFLTYSVHNYVCLIRSVSRMPIAPEK